MAVAQPPAIVVPGITAASLEDQYPLAPEEVWSPILNKSFERISMHPDDLRYEAIEPARVQPRSLFGIIYDDLVLALRHDLSPRADRPTPVFAFPYDWRQDCARSALHLGEFIGEVLARTRLLPHYSSAPPERVDIIAHSMGGIVTAELLARMGAKARVRRVVSLGTPFRGAIDAVSKLATGMGTLTGDQPRDRERETARTIPALYQLLPSFDGAVIGPREHVNLFRAGAWQASIAKTLNEYCRLHRAKTDGASLLEALLKLAATQRQRTERLSLDEALPEGRAGWLALIGIGAPTQTRLDNQKRRFVFFEPEDQPGTERTGDGTVPFLGACPSFLERERLVCISPEDFSLWELKDRALAHLTGFHSVLPTVNLIQRLSIKFLRESFRGEVSGRPPPGVTQPDWPRWLRPAPPVSSRD